MARNTRANITYIGISNPQKSRIPTIGLAWNKSNQPLIVPGCGKTASATTSPRVQRGRGQRRRAADDNKAPIGGVGSGGNSSLGPSLSIALLFKRMEFFNRRVNKMPIHKPALPARGHLSTDRPYRLLPRDGGYPQAQARQADEGREAEEYVCRE